MLVGVGEDQRLGDEVEIGQAARRELEVEGVPLPLFACDQGPHGMGLPRHDRWIALDGDGLGDGGLDFGRECHVPADYPGAGERHVLPGLRLLPLVAQEPPELGRHRPLVAGGPQPEVHFIEAPPAARHGQCRDEALGEAGIVDRSV